jgi:hypothetical protein
MPSDLNINDRKVATTAAASRSQWDRVSRNLGTSETTSSSRVTVVEQEATRAHEPALEPPSVATHALSVSARFQSIPWEHGASAEPDAPARPAPGPAPAPELKRTGPLTVQERFSMVPWVEGAQDTPGAPALDLEELAQAARERSAALSLSAFFKDTKW